MEAKYSRPASRRLARRAEKPGMNMLIRSVGVIPQLAANDIINSFLLEDFDI
jgi:hypothetical protein